MFCFLKGRKEGYGGNRLMQSLVVFYYMYCFLEVFRSSKCLMQSLVVFIIYVFSWGIPYNIADPLRPQDLYLSIYLCVLVCLCFFPSSRTNMLYALSTFQKEACNCNIYFNRLIMNILASVLIASPQSYMNGPEVANWV